MKIWGSNNSGYSNNTGRTITPTLKGSNTDPTTNSWAGTAIGSITPFANAWATTAKDTLGNANAIRYRYVWLELTITAADSAFLAEVQFFETLNGVETAIDPTGKTQISAGYNTRISASFDGVTNQASTSGTTGPSGSTFQIGLDLGS
jgi:hypothetical protein